MKKKKIVIKSTGKKEAFDIEKFKRSLQRSGAHPDIINYISKEVELKPNLRTTKDIYTFAMKRLKKLSRPLAARYNLKMALIELGPSGFPFEHYVAQLFREQGYKTEVSVVVNGNCVNHEIDVFGKKDNTHLIIESKFHNRYGLKSDVKVALYVKARFDDIMQYYNDRHSAIRLKTLLVTNTQFTTQAIAYANCVNLSMLGWGYPKDKSLEQLIVQNHLIPITALTTLNKKQKRSLMKDGCVLCRDVTRHKDDLKKLGLNQTQIKKIVDEAKGVCALK